MKVYKVDEISRKSINIANRQKALKILKIHAVFDFDEDLTRSPPPQAVLSQRPFWKAHFVMLAGL